MAFPQQLARFRRSHRIGRMTVCALAILAITSGLVLLLLGADLALAFESSARVFLLSVLGGLFSVGALIMLVLAFRLSATQTAAVADDTLSSPRRPVSAALALDPNESPTALGTYLRERLFKEAGDALQQLPMKRAIPWRPLRQWAIAIGALCLALLGFRWLAPAPFATTWSRLLHPHSDIPPWSPLQFTITPAKPEVIYGSDLLLTCDLQGGKIEHPVECLLRTAGSRDILRLPVAREAATRFSRKLEAITQPIEIAFACGKARSQWIPVDLRLQPNVLSGTIEIAPPDYMGLQPMRSPLDTSELLAPEGSSIRLDLTSNRPLGSAALTFTPARTGSSASVPVEFKGDVSGHVASFRFTATQSGSLAVLIRDVRGTPSAKPTELTLKTQADQAPAIELTNPPSLLLATPKSTIPIAASVEDDHGLSRIQLVRTLSGFRDRSLPIARGLVQTRSYDLKNGLDLASLGLQIGQTIELFVEASDYNPSLLGQGTSGIARIQIISEEDYASRLRAKTTLREFSTRYQLLERSVQQARETLDALQANKNDPAALEKAKEAHRQAARQLEALARDFPVFEMEKRLKDLASEAAAAAQANLDDLAKFETNANAQMQQEAIKKMQERLGRKQQDREQLQQDAKTVTEAGQVLEMAAKFQQIYQTQQSITKRIETIAKEISLGNDQNKRLLASLGDTQQKNREALEDFARNLEQRANALKDPTLQPMRDSALEFIQRLRLADPGSVMEAAAKHARDGASTNALANAELARGMLETLMQQNQPFPNACNGRCMSFSIPRPDVNATMQQLLEGLLGQNPGTSPNQGLGGGGMGMGGTGPTGNAQPGFGMVDIPVLGPQRLMFDPASLGGSGNGESLTPRPKELPTHTESSTSRPVEDRNSASGAPESEHVPAQYRDAVKRYFTRE